MEEKENKNDNSPENLFKFDKTTKRILWLVLIIVSISFIAPFIITRESVFGFASDSTGFIGDTIGGIMSPIIAIAGIGLTFLAFYIQYNANQMQINAFREEQNEQQIQYKKNQIENQFYEMLRLHKDNVNEINIVNKNSNFEVHGRQTFEYFQNEFELYYHIIRVFNPKLNPNEILKISYSLFFLGIYSNLSITQKQFDDLLSIRDSHRTINYAQLPYFLKEKLGFEITSIDLNYELFTGYSGKLAHYFRHLFQTVKFIANQDEKLISYNEKRKYLRILRAQLSNQEQVMLFYNWLSQFGGQWENETNRYFTDYRMIHNIYQDLLLPEFSLKEIFKDDNFRKEEGREKDPLFEFQDWN